MTEGDTFYGITAFVACFLGYLIGFWHGWRWGKKYGEADGVAWATNRLEEERKR